MGPPVPTPPLLRASLSTAVPSPVGIFPVVARFDALERKGEKSLSVEVQIGLNRAKPKNSAW
jgi:hypothetical protein